MNKKTILTILVGTLICFGIPMAIQSDLGSRVIAGELLLNNGGKFGRRGAKRKRCFRKCPKCDADVCFLKCENAKTTKVCFDVDQKVICIPRVTFPWQKCPPKCAKARTVNVLGVKEYECCECKYTWKLCEPELPQIPEMAPTQPGFEPEIPQPEVPAEVPEYELYDPAGSDVPTPPTTGDRFN